MFARIAALLSNTLKKDQPKHFGVLTAEELHVMHKLQENLVSSPVLALPNARGKNTIDTDACNVHVWSVFLHLQLDGTTKPVGCWSRWLAKAEPAYYAIRRECLAIVWSVWIV